MTQSTNHKFKGSFYKLEYPPSWEKEIIEDVLCFFKEDGCGVLQIAATRSEHGFFQLNNELISHLNRNQISFEPEKIVSYKIKSNLEAVAIEYMTQGRFWLVQMIGFEDKLLIVIYNADEPPDQSLSIEISGIISSIVIH